MTSIFGLGKDKCPTNTVPIMRITKDDLIREKSLLNDDILVKDLPGVHVRYIIKLTIKMFILYFY